MEVTLAELVFHEINMGLKRTTGSNFRRYKHFKTLKSLTNNSLSDILRKKKQTFSQPSQSGLKT